MRFNQQMATVSKRAWAEKYVSLIKTVQVEGVKSSLDDHFDNILNVLFLHARRNGSLLLTQAWMTWQRLFYEIDVFWEKVAGSVRPLGAACRRRKAGSAFHIWARHTRRINALSEAVHRHEAALRHVRVQLLRMLSGDNYRSTSNVQLAFACWVRKWKEVTWQEKHADVQTARMYSVLSAFAKGHTVRVKSRMMSSWVQWKSVAMYKAHHSRTQQEISALLSWEHKRSAARSLVEFRCRIKRAVWHKWCLQHVRMVSAEALQATKQKSAEALQATKQKAAMSRIKATIFACFRDGTHYSRAALISRWTSWKEFVVGERLQNERMAKALRSMVNCRRSMLRKAWQKWEAYDGKGARDALLRRVKGVLARRLQAIEDGHGTGVRLAWMRWKHANAARRDAMRASEERALSQIKAALSRYARDDRHYAQVGLLARWTTWKRFTATHSAAMRRIKATISKYFRDDAHYSKVVLLSKFGLWKEFRATQSAAMLRIKATVSRYFRDGTHYSRAALISRWASWKEFAVGKRLQNERMAKALRSMVNCRRSMLRKAWQKWEAYDGKGARDALLRRVKGVLARRLQAIEDGHGTGVRLAWMRWKHANAARGDAMRASEERMRRTLETFARNRRGRIAPLMVRLAIATWQYFTAKSREEEAFDINVLNQRAFDAELHEIDRRIAPLARSLAVYQRRFIATTIRTSVQARLRESFSRWLRRALRSNARPTSAASQQERSPPVKESPQRQQHLHLRRLISRRISMPMPLPESLL